MIYSFSFSGISIISNEVQSSKHSFPIFVTVVGILICLNFQQFENTLSPISFTDVGISIF